MISPFVFKALAFLLVALFSTAVLAQNDGYIGYELHKRGDPESANYETADTPGIELPIEPDVYLNASVSVGLISIEVDNITAKVNLDAKVLNLLHFTAGVDASIDRVSLRIENVSAKVELEARLGNVVAMVNDVLNAIDLNPIIATLGNNVGSIVGNVTDAVGGGGTGGSSSTPASTDTQTVNAKRDLHDYNLLNNILYSINDYSGQTHTNRVLAQNGSIYDQFLDNNGDERGRRVVGFYSKDMTFTGHNRSITIDGQTEFELGYDYRPFPGLEVVANVYVTPSGKVVKTKLIAEAEGGGTSTISDDAAQ